MPASAQRLPSRARWGRGRGCLRAANAGPSFETPASPRQGAGAGLLAPVGGAARLRTYAALSCSRCSRRRERCSRCRPGANLSLQDNRLDAFFWFAPGAPGEKRVDPEEKAETIRGNGRFGGHIQIAGPSRGVPVRGRIEREIAPVGGFFRWFKKWSTPPGLVQNVRKVQQ